MFEGEVLRDRVKRFPRPAVLNTDSRYDAYPLGFDENLTFSISTDPTG
jgi:hypothetical protein